MMVFSLSASNVSSNNFFIKPNSIISGNELTQVANEILTKAPSTQNTQNTQSAQTNINLPQINPNTYIATNRIATVFGPNSTLANQQVKQAATNQAAYDVTLSNKTLSDIQSLNVNAASLQVANVSNKMDGKVFVPIDLAKAPSDLKEVFTFTRPAQFFNTNSLDKDKKGSGNSFYSNNQSKQEQKEEGLNLVI